MTDQAKELGSDAEPDHVATPQQADRDSNLTSRSAKDNGAHVASDDPRGKQDDASDSKDETGPTESTCNDPATNDDAMLEESGEQKRDAAAEETEDEDNEEEDDENEDEDDQDEDDDEEEDEDEDEEPSLKISRLTPHLNSVYRNGDATSAFLVAGDKMVSFHPNPLRI